MVIVLKKDITQEEKSNIKGFLTERKFKINEVVGEEETILAAVGRVALDLREVEIMKGVSKVVPISKAYKLASREFNKEDTVVEIPNSRGQIIRVGGSRIVTIAGPCAVESREQMLEVAQAVAASGAVMLRGGAYKPRTSPYSFQGLGEEGLKYLKEAGEKYGLPVVTEVVDASYLPVMKDYVDVYQVGARNMQNFELLKKLGAMNKPVILKRGLAATMEDLLMSAEYLLANGTDKVILCERGIRTFEKATRNTLDLSAVPVLRGLTHLPIIVDPSHAVGIRDKIPPMGLAAIAGGADGIIVEVHCHPEKALSDGPQSLYPEQFNKLMHDIEALAPVVGKSVAHIREEAPVKAAKEKSAGKSEIKCAYSGNPGAYAQQAVERYFDGEKVEAVAVNSFSDIFQAVTDGKVDFGMIPIENSLAGSIYENYDNFRRYQDVSIVGSVTLNIRHVLLGCKGAKLSDVKNVYSHPQGFSQCRKIMDENQAWNHIDSTSTATAAKIVSELKNKENAAIASAVNAQIYGLEILKEDIEDNPGNFTRFVVLAANNAEPKIRNSNLKPNKASIIFKTKNEPGALFRSLEIFANRKMNLTRLESRPIPGETWNYWFYSELDVSGLAETLSEAEIAERINTVLGELKNHAEDVRLLGIYS